MREPVQSLVLMLSVNHWIHRSLVLGVLKWFVLFDCEYKIMIYGKSLFRPLRHTCLSKQYIFHATYVMFSIINISIHHILSTNHQLHNEHGTSRSSWTVLSSFLHWSGYLHSCQMQCHTFSLLHNVSIWPYCMVFVSAPEGQVIEIDFRDKFYLEPSPNCENDYLLVSFVHKGTQKKHHFHIHCVNSNMIDWKRSL